MENQIVNTKARSGMSIQESAKVLDEMLAPVANDMPVVTSLFTTEVKLRCPHCNEVNDGFIGDPAGLEFECDYCGKPYKVHSEADVEFGY